MFSKLLHIDDSSLLGYYAMFTTKHITNMSPAGLTSSEKVAVWKMGLH